MIKIYTFHKRSPSALRQETWAQSGNTLRASNAHRHCRHSLLGICERGSQFAQSDLAPHIVPQTPLIQSWRTWLLSTIGFFPLYCRVRATSVDNRQEAMSGCLSQSPPSWNLSTLPAWNLLFFGDHHFLEGWRWKTIYTLKYKQLKIKKKMEM